MRAGVVERWGSRFRARHVPDRQSLSTDELKLQQSFSSVVNDPAKPQSIGDIIRDLVDDEEDELEEEEASELHGVPVPQLPDFQAYLDSFADVWDAYALSHRHRVRHEEDLCHAHNIVPREYFQEDFGLGRHEYFEDLRRTVWLQEQLNDELSGYMDAVEVSLFKSIQEAQHNRVFDSMVDSSKPLCQDMAKALIVVKNLRSRLKSAQRAHLQCGAVAARLARRKARVAEVLELLGGFSRMEQLENEVGALVQRRDYAAALQLLESGSTALEKELDVFTSVEVWCSRLARLGRSVSLSVQADFVQLSTEVTLGTDKGGIAALQAASAAEGTAERSHDMETLRMLCWCLAQRRELRSILGSALRDKLLFELKRAVRLQVQRTLEDLRSAAGAEQGALLDAEAGSDLMQPSEDPGPGMESVPEQEEEDLANDPADVGEVSGAGTPFADALPEEEDHPPKESSETPTPHKGKSKSRSFLKKVKVRLRSTPSKSSDAGVHAPSTQSPVTPALAEPSDNAYTFGGASSSSAPPEVVSRAATAVADITSSVGELNVEGFSAFWERTLAFSIELANSFFAFADCVQGVAQSPGEGKGSGDDEKPHKAENVASELLQLGDDILEALLQKVGILFQARQARHQHLKVLQWRHLMTITAEALDRIGTLQREWSDRLGPEVRHVSRHLGAGLWAILVAQTKPIVQAFHQCSLAEVQASLECERWERVDVPGTYSQLLAEIVGTCVEQQHEQLDVSTEKAIGQQEQEPDRCIYFRGLRFLVVPALLTLVNLLAQYMRLCRDWGSCGPQIVWCMVQLLRHFNQQAHKLVLGGQAVHSQTLKKINATHLALCCQCCSLVEALVPCMQELLLQILEEGCPLAQDLVMEPVGELSKVVSEFAGHRTEVFDKLTAILRERYDHHSKRWLGCPHPEMDDSVVLPQGSDAQPDITLHPHSALEGLVKDVTAMYTVLWKSLNPESVQKIFGKAFAEIAGKFEQRVGSGLAAPSPPYEGTAWRSLGDRLLMDIAFLQEQLGRLSGISLPLQHLLSDLAYHTRARLSLEDPLRQVHPATLEVLQKSGKVPQ